MHSEAKSAHHAIGVTQDYAAVLKKPRVTEKATWAMGAGVYVFEVPQDVNKGQVAESVRKLYNVTPRKVNMVAMRPRKFVSRMRGRRGQKRGFKKAYVYLKKGERIDLV